MWRTSAEGGGTRPLTSEFGREEGVSKGGGIRNKQEEEGGEKGDYSLDLRRGRRKKGKRRLGIRKREKKRTKSSRFQPGKRAGRKNQERDPPPPRGVYGKTMVRLGGRRSRNNLGMALRRPDPRAVGKGRKGGSRRRKRKGRARKWRGHTAFLLGGKESL